MFKLKKKDVQIDEKYIKYLKSERKGLNYNYTDTRTKIIDGFYHVYPVDISKKQVCICCPYCKEFHVHGNEDGDYSGHKVAHCSGHKDKNNGYFIEKIPEE